MQRHEISIGIRVPDDRHTLMSVLTIHIVVVVVSIITSECRLVSFVYILLPQSCQLMMLTLELTLLHTNITYTHTHTHTHVHSVQPVNAWVARSFMLLCQKVNNSILTVIKWDFVNSHSVQGVRSNYLKFKSIKSSKNYKFPLNVN